MLIVLPTKKFIGCLSGSVWRTRLAAYHSDRLSPLTAPVRRHCRRRRRFDNSPRARESSIGMLGDVLRVMLFDHWTMVLCSDATSLIGTFCSSIRTMLECRSAYIVASAGSSTDVGDDLARPRDDNLRRDCQPTGCRRSAAAAAHRRRRPSSRLSQPGRQLHGDRHRIAFGLLRAAISAATLGRSSASSTSAAPDDRANPRRVAGRPGSVVRR